jgi:F0F1-type ATP synthase assembly protein I
MSDNKFSDNEMVEPEGFWPDEPSWDQEPYETIPYTPDMLEFIPSEEPFAEGPAPEQVAHSRDDETGGPVEDHMPPVEHYEDTVGAPLETIPGGMPTDEGSAIAADNDGQSSYKEPNAGHREHTIPVSEAHSHTYQTSADREFADQVTRRELIDTRSWLDQPGTPVEQPAPGDYPPQAPADTWQAPPKQFADPFSPDSFNDAAANDYWVGKPAYSDPNAPVHYVPETPEESIRRSGLAWSAGIAFFGSVAFMLFLGWLADLLLGTAPWGMVGGIVFGSVIGFIQFFRISSQIYGTSKESSEFRPLFTRSDDVISDESPDPPAVPPPL